jgi:hypothetical protein
MFLSSLYEALMSRIQTTDLTIYVDLYSGQFEDEGEEELPFPRPAVFIEFNTDDEVKAIGNGWQQIDMIITIYIVDDVIQESSSLTNSTVRGVGYAHLNRIDVISNALQGFNSNTLNVAGLWFNSLQMTSVGYNKNNGALYVHAVSFKTMVKYGALAKVTTEVDADLRIT